LKVQDGSPAYSELRRGDIIKKIGDYDARDLRHEDANSLFKSTGNSIKLVVQRQIVGIASRTVAQWTKAACFGSGSRDARWFESPWGKKFPRGFSASVWDRCPPSIVRKVGSYDRDPSSGAKPGIKPAAVPVVPIKAPVAGGVPTPFAAAALPVTNSTASPVPRHLSSPNPMRCASPVVFPPPLPTGQDFPYPHPQPGVKPHVQFRPVEPDEEQEEELANISNQVRHFQLLLTL
ncbi:hypothetical protein C0J52_21770, partial [Blattella germanica]